METTEIIATYQRGHNSANQSTDSAGGSIVSEGRQEKWF